MDEVGKDRNALKTCHAEALPKHLRTDYIAKPLTAAEILRFAQNDIIFYILRAAVFSVLIVGKCGLLTCRSRGRRSWLPSGTAR